MVRVGCFFFKLGLCPQRRLCPACLWDRELFYPKIAFSQNLPFCEVTKGFSSSVAGSWRYLLYKPDSWPLRRGLFSHSHCTQLAYLKPTQENFHANIHCSPVKNSKAGFIQMNSIRERAFRIKLSSTLSTVKAPGC